MAFNFDSNGVDLAANGPPDLATISWGIYSDVTNTMSGRDQSTFSSDQLTMQVARLVGQQGIEIVRILGDGASSMVFKGQLEDRSFVVKALKAVDPPSQSEREILDKVKHPNIVQFLGIIQGPPLCCLLEYCAGGDLFKVLHESSVQLSLRTQSSIACEMASALAYIHSEGVMHRDVKSPNVLLSEPIMHPGHTPVAKLADLGLSKQVDTAMTKGVGTARWMAPEVMDNTYGLEADVYSFIILLWELFARKVPFAKYSSIDAVTKAVLFRGERPDVSAAVGVSLEMHQLMERGWCKEPESRPTMEEVYNTVHSHWLNTGE
eukprot:gnl/MRDRNA2_/MRDRNA2_86552_c0_seq3.p1 gnl/MRDRNA2_/MRDRNA2_86552_c0~~gnl/MRDRNA2_/MRDRNA2_86552_c0_seq3.p1  ORF type:complete len:370 (+),score=55.27 gnl/MRDRNA2_/MRDRNA2_86552_c0_seq3:152-1111(+)